MKDFLLLLALLMLGSGALLAQDCGPIPAADNKVYPWCYKPNEGTNWNTSAYKPFIINGLRFRLLYPKGYSTNSTKKYPLVILMHGLGMGGTDNNIQLKIGGQKHLEALNNGSYDGFVMVPQAQGELWSSAERATILKFVTYALEHYSVDPYRVQLEGYSAGGEAAWKLAFENPLVFSAAIVMSVANGNTARSYAQVLRYMPTWHAQGGRDTHPQPATGERVAAEFNALGANYRYQYYHELGHGTWEAMYEEPDFFPFLMRSAMHTIHAKHFKYNFCNGETVTGIMGIRSGFEAYEWRKDGSATGGNTHEIAFSQTGNYTVRFKHKGQWSSWSDPLEIKRVAPTSRPAIVAIGPTALPTLDGRTTVTLRAPADQQNYLWSNGSRLDSLVVDKAGAYSVSVTAPYGCPSSSSAPIHVTYNSVGVLKAPASLTVAAVSVTELQLRWLDNSNDESGFELYRSRTENGPWVLVAQLTANSNSYLDKGLNSFTRYYYSLRSVNDKGGSDYLVGNGKTYSDAIAPQVPAELTITTSSRTSIGLSWLPSADNATEANAITYEVWANGNVLVGTTNRTKFTAKDLPELEVYNFRVRAIDQIGNKSAFSNQVTAGTYINGLYYTYYEGALSSVHDISLLKPLKVGRVPNFTLNIPGRAPNKFALSFEGNINIPTKGTYTFFTTSDDGSTLSIDGLQVVNNDKIHTSRERSGTVELTEGIHEIKVLYFEELGDTEGLQVSWEGPGIAKQPIPDKAFAEQFSLPAPPASPTAVTATALDANNIQLKWTQTGANPAAIEVYRSLAKNGPFVLIKTTESSQGATYTDAALAPATTYYYKLRAVSKAGESDFAGYTAGNWVNATTKAGGLPAPTELRAQRTARNHALLKWKDNAEGEKGYEVWRSPDGNNFTRIANTPENVKSYTDNEVDAATIFNYRVRAVATNAQSEWSNVAVLSSDNKAPEITGFPTEVVANEGKTTKISFDLKDANGDSIKLISRYFPQFVRIEKAGPDKAEIILSPTVKDIGFYSGLQLTASDGMLETDLTFNIKIVNSEKTSVYVNVGSNTINSTPWNNTSIAGGQSDKVVIENMIDEYGAATGYSLTLLDAWSASKAYGETSGNNSGVFPDLVTKSAYLINPGSTARMKVSGLKPNQRYNFVFFGSSIFKSNNGSTVYAIGNEKVSLAVQSNIDKTVQLNGIQPNGKGEVILSISGAEDATKGGFLNALVIEQYPDNGKLLRPAKFMAQPVSRSEVALSWTDKAYQEEGFEIWRRTLPADSFQLVAKTEANITSFLDKELNANTGYEYKVRAFNNGSYSAYSETKQAATLMYEVLINTNYTKNMGDPWINLDQRPTTGYTWYNFQNDEMLNTGINLKLDQSFDGNNLYGPDAQGKGIYHDNVIKTFYYNEIGTVAKMRFYGLDDELLYNFRFFASSVFEGGESGVTVYRIGNKKVSLDAQNNLSNTASIRDIQPINGSIVVEIEAGEFARYGYINALELEVRDGYKEIKGATPSDLFAEPALEEDKLNQIASVYPNPTQDILKISFLAKAAGACAIQVYDLTGRLMQVQEVTAKQGMNTFTIDLANTLMSKGLYLVRVKSTDFESKAARFVKY